MNPKEEFSILTKILDGSFDGLQATDVETIGPETRKVKARTDDSRKSMSFLLSTNSHYGLMQKFILCGDVIPNSYVVEFGGTVVCSVQTKLRKHLVEQKGIHLRIPPIVVHPFVQLVLHIDYEEPIQQDIFAQCEYLAYDVSHELSLYQAYPVVEQKLYENEDLTGEGLWFCTSKTKHIESITFDSSTELDSIDNLPASKFIVKAAACRYTFFYRLSVDAAGCLEHVVKGRANTNLIVSHHGHMLLKLEAE